MIIKEKNGSTLVKWYHGCSKKFKFLVITFLVIGTKIVH